ncbi:MAG TPA: phage holin family protein, partial [Syntrophorhabdaceae bacterium]|nr:phage holin family protein [Syntrophorhabdaceae bacterium]
MERAYKETGSRESFTELLKQLATSSSDMVRNEIALITQELKDKVKALSSGALMVTAAALVAFVALMSLFAAAIIGLSAYMNAGLAALLVGLISVLAAGVFIMAGVRKLKQAVPKTLDKRQ